MTFAEQLLCSSPALSGGDNEEKDEVLVLTVTAQQAQTKNQKLDRQEFEQDKHCGSRDTVVD